MISRINESGSYNVIVVKSAQTGVTTDQKEPSVLLRINDDPRLFFAIGKKQVGMLIQMLEMSAAMLEGN